MLMPLILTVSALVSIVKNGTDNANKLIWVIIVIFMPILGSILYFIIGRPKQTEEIDPDKF